MQKATMMQLKQLCPKESISVTQNASKHQTFVVDLLIKEISLVCSLKLIGIQFLITAN